MTSGPIFDLTDVVKRRHAGDGAVEFELAVPHLRIQPGERLAMVAPSGGGKSTLIDLLVLVSRPSDSASFLFRPPDGEAIDVAAMWAEDASDGLGAIRRRHIGVVLQTGGLLPFVSVRWNIELPRRLLGLADDGTVMALAERLGIAHLLARRPGKLSVGERQRVAIARALSHRPTVVIADEPTASLDEATAERTMALLLEMVEQSGVTLILSSHNVDLIDRHGIPRLGHDIHSAGAGAATCSRFWSAGAESAAA